MLNDSLTSNVSDGIERVQNKSFVFFQAVSEREGSVRGPGIVLKMMKRS